MGRKTNITEWQFHSAERDPCGDRWAIGECRICGRDVKVMADIHRGEVFAISSGSLRDCDHEKCGEKFPALLHRMSSPPKHPRVAPTS